MNSVMTILQKGVFLFGTAASDVARSNRTFSSTGQYLNRTENTSN